MIRTLSLYIRQRFDPRLFGGLAILLQLYAIALEWSPLGAIAGFVYILALLFAFRLFDDIASREIDHDKPDRIYTEEGPYMRLRMFLAPFLLVLLVATAFVDLRSGIVLGAWLVLQAVAYRVLFEVAPLRPVLPLLKYPVLSLLLALMFVGDAAVTWQAMLAHLSLLPVFILFESIDEPDLEIRPRIRAALIVVAHLLLAPAMDPEWYPIAGPAMLLFLIFFVDRRVAIPNAQYWLLVYFVILRVVTSYHGL